MPAPENDLTAYLPPEICGVLHHAQRHLDASRAAKYYPLYKHRDRTRRHAEKVQKLVARAARMMAARGVPCP